MQIPINPVYHVASVLLYSIYLLQFTNNSNFPSRYIIPAISVLSVKYFLGDFDIGYQWTASDLLFWLCLSLLSYTVVVLFENEKSIF